MDKFAVAKFALDSKSVREIDANGNLHVSVSPFTKVQVAPYQGREIPDWESLKLEPNKVYYGYRSAEELSKPETVKSINGIPIQLRHHVDYADAPAKSTRIGSTGDQAEWKAPYLMNSLHIQDKKAIDLIESEAMRELSLAYAYTPDFTAGTSDDGEDYDFVMRNIIANHIALVEEGRAGHDVLVFDAKNGECCMDDDMKEVVHEQPNQEVEKKELEIANKMIEAGQALLDLHKTEGEDEKEELKDKAEPIVDIEKKEEEVKEEVIPEKDDEEKTEVEEEKKELAFGAKDEDKDVEELEDEKEESEEDKDEEEQDKEEVAKDEDEVEEPVAESVEDVLKQFGVDPAKFIKALKMIGSLEDKIGGEDACAKDEDVQVPAIGMDSKTVAFDKKETLKMMDAVEEVRPVLGKIRCSAFDCAGDIYISALKQVGITQGVTQSNARAVFLAYMRGDSRNGMTGLRTFAEDSAPRIQTPMEKLLSKVH